MVYSNLELNYVSHALVIQIKINMAKEILIQMLNSLETAYKEEL